jgi:hypothetical protein
MKKILSLLPFILACCLLMGVIGWGLFGIYEITCEAERLKALPGASGVDYLGLHGGIMVYGTGVFLISACGLVAAGVSRKVVKSGKLHTASGILMVLLGVLLFLPVGACLLGML